MWHLNCFIMGYCINSMWPLGWPKPKMFWSHACKESMSLIPIQKGRVKNSSSHPERIKQAAPNTLLPYSPCLFLSFHTLSSFSPLFLLFAPFSFPFPWNPSLLPWFQPNPSLIKIPRKSPPFPLSWLLSLSGHASLSSLPPQRRNYFAASHQPQLPVHRLRPEAPPPQRPDPRPPPLRLLLLLRLRRLHGHQLPLRLRHLGRLRRLQVSKILHVSASDSGVPFFSLRLIEFHVDSSSRPMPSSPCIRSSLWWLPFGRFSRAPLFFQRPYRFGSTSAMTRWVQTGSSFFLSEPACFLSF